MMSAELIGCMNPLCPSSKKKREGETYLKLNVAGTGTYSKSLAEGKERSVCPRGLERTEELPH